MADIEKVIEGLEICLLNYDDKCEECPYKSDSTCFWKNKRDALELLKEQQAEIKRLKEQHPIKPEIFGSGYWCGKCDDYIMTVKQAGTPMNRQKVRFCCHCGHPIDWKEFEQDGEQE